MADPQERVEHFRKMAEADPGNELGHLSLGNALLDAGEPAAALQSFRRAIELNPRLSKAYQQLAQAQMLADDAPGAVATLSAGVKVAHEAGDMLPRNAMVSMLKQLGAAVPQLEERKPAEIGQGELLCSRCGQVRPKMARAPFKRALGQVIHANVCAACWDEWIRMGTKVINELRLPLSDPAAQRIYDEHMQDFLNLRKEPGA